MWGFQLWVNLPAAHKMDPPRYQDIPPGEIPERTQDGARIRVIAGESDGVPGPVRGIVTSPLYLDVSVPARGRFTHPIPAGHSAMVYVFEGEGEVGLDESGKGRLVQTGRLAILDDGAQLAALAGENGMRFLVIAARPLGEPVARYGPFVMNTREEIMQAMADFQAGNF